MIHKRRKKREFRSEEYAISRRWQEDLFREAIFERTLERKVAEGMRREGRMVRRPSFEFQWWGNVRSWGMYTVHADHHNILTVFLTLRRPDHASVPMVAERYLLS